MGLVQPWDHPLKFLVESMYSTFTTAFGPSHCWILIRPRTNFNFLIGNRVEPHFDWWFKSRKFMTSFRFINSAEWSDAETKKTGFHKGQVSPRCPVDPRECRYIWNRSPVTHRSGLSEPYSFKWDQHHHSKWLEDGDMKLFNSNTYYSQNHPEDHGYGQPCWTVSKWDPFFGKRSMMIASESYLSFCFLWRSCLPQMVGNMIEVKNRRKSKFSCLLRT